MARPMVPRMKITTNQTMDSSKTGEATRRPKKQIDGIFRR
jgi:hypothetical protein